MRARRWLTLILLVVAACGSRPPGTTSLPDRSYISPEEIASSGQTDAFGVVQLLRPQWLNTRGRGSITQQEGIKVYLDDSLMGGVEYLRQITARSIASIRYYDGLEATQRWGLDHGLGAIAVATRAEAN